MADAAAAAWGWDAGTARFWRSSASHVFALVVDDEVAGYLRMVPDGHRRRDEVTVVAGLTARLSAAGQGVTAPVRSLGGRLVETVQARTRPHARHGGRGLARAAAPAGGPAGTGLVHGDFEPDNLRWDGAAVTGFDFDRRGRVPAPGRGGRDRGPGGRPDLRDAFLAGYGVDVPAAVWRLFRALQAVDVLRRLDGVRDLPVPHEEAWLTRLDRAVAARQATERERVLAAGRAAGSSVA